MEGLTLDRLIQILYIGVGFGVFIAACSWGPGFLRLVFPALSSLLMSIGRPAVAPADEVVDEVVIDEDLGVVSVAIPYNALNADVDVVNAAKVQALAAVMIESQKTAFAGGRVPETRCIEAVFSVKRSSVPGSPYQLFKSAVAAELVRLRAPAPVVFPPLLPGQAACRDELQLDS